MAGAAAGNSLPRFVLGGGEFLSGVKTFRVATMIHPP
jgi:hypothetical protein